MTHTIDDVQDELETDNRFSTELTDDGILRIQSDSWAESPFGDIDEVQVYEVGEDLFDAHPVGDGGERFEMPFKRTIHYISSSMTE